MTTGNADRLRAVIQHMEDNGISLLKCSMQISLDEYVWDQYNEKIVENVQPRVLIEFDFSNQTHRNIINIKRVFGPLEGHGSDTLKWAVGTYTLDKFGGIEIEIHLNRYMECERTIHCKPAKTRPDGFSGHLFLEDNA